MTVKVYTQPNCVQCQATFRRLDKLGVPFTPVDITQDDKAYKYVQSLGYQQVPVVDTGNAHWSGYRPDCLNGLATRKDTA